MTLKRSAIDFNPSITLELKFQTLTRTEGLKFALPFNAITTLRCTEAAGI